MQYTHTIPTHTRTAIPSTTHYPTSTAASPCSARTLWLCSRCICVCVHVCVCIYIWMCKHAYVYVDVQVDHTLTHTHSRLTPATAASPGTTTPPSCTQLGTTRATTQTIYGHLQRAWGMWVCVQKSSVYKCLYIHIHTHTHTHVQAKTQHGSITLFRVYKAELGLAYEAPTWWCTRLGITTKIAGGVVCVYAIVYNKHTYTYTHNRTSALIS
jgi:hypothetical protein